MASTVGHVVLVGFGLEHRIVLPKPCCQSAISSLLVEESQIPAVGNGLLGNRKKVEGAAHELNCADQVVSLPEWVMREYENSLDLTGEV